jgi:hypothetical protein
LRNRSKPGSCSRAAVVWDRVRDRALVFYSKDRKHSQNGGAIRTRVGTSLALWPRPDAPATRPVVRPGAEEPTLLFDADEPPWGSAAVVVGPWLYAYACEGAKGSLDVPCLLARVRLEDVFDRSAWRFHTRASWTPDWHAAIPAIVGGFRQMSVEWNEYLAKYVAINAELLSNRIRVRTSDRPEGPWSDVARFEARGSDFFDWIGPSLGHAELAKEGGRRGILTYTRGVGFSGSEMRAMEVEFRKR